MVPEFSCYRLLVYLECDLSCVYQVTEGIEVSGSRQSRARL